MKRLITAATLLALLSFGTVGFADSAPVIGQYLTPDNTSTSLPDVNSPLSDFPVTFTTATLGVTGGIQQTTTNSGNSGGGSTTGLQLVVITDTPVYVYMSATALTTPTTQIPALALFSPGTTLYSSSTAINSSQTFFTPNAFLYVSTNSTAANYSLLTACVNNFNGSSAGALYPSIQPTAINITDATSVNEQATLTLSGGQCVLTATP